MICFLLNSYSVEKPKDSVALYCPTKDPNAHASESINSG